MSSVPQRIFTEEEYLEFENRSESRHEFYRGEIFAMTGGSPRHALIIANLTAALAVRLSEGPCRVYSGDLRVRVETARLYTYADLSVVCGELQADHRDPNSTINPSALFEVLSPSTETYDRTDKAGFYREIAALRHYVLVSQSRPHVEVLTRRKKGTWQSLETAGLDQSAPLTELGVSLPLAEIYRGVNFTPGPQG